MINQQPQPQYVARQCAGCSNSLLIPKDAPNYDEYALAAAWSMDLAGAWLCPKCR